jgi:hypothetical protein
MSYPEILTIPSSTKPLEIIPGYGMEKLSREEWQDLPWQEWMGKAVVWQAPQPQKHTYVISADVSEGIGKDRSVAEVVRLGTVEQPEEQVAEFVSDSIDPIDFAGVIDAMGRFYSDEAGTPALCAVEVNNHGLATQRELSRHLGYDNFYIWQVEDSADPTRRFTNRVGFYTNRSTRPALIQLFVKKVKTVDVNTGIADFKINSPFLIEELRSFQTLGALYDAEAEAGSFDDCIMASAIALYVCQTLQYETFESVADSRKRQEEERSRQSLQEQFFGKGRDHRNTEVTWKEQQGIDEEEDFDD